MANKSQDRKSWDDTQKAQTAERILGAHDRRKAYEETRKELDIQPYQLYAWIGQYMVDNRIATLTPGAVTAAEPSAMSRFIGEHTLLTEDEKKDIALWIFRKYIMSDNVRN